MVSTGVRHDDVGRAALRGEAPPVTFGYEIAAQMSAVVPMTVRLRVAPVVESKT